MPTAAPTRRRRVARWRLATAFALAVVGTSARIETRALADPAATRAPQVVAIIPTEPARLTVLDARTLRRVRGSWSVKLASWSPDHAAVLSPAGSRVAAVHGEGSDSTLIVDAATGRVVRRVKEISVESLYWLRGEGVRKTSPAVVVDATFACSGGNGGVCGDDVNVVWTSDPRLEPGGSVIYDTFFVEAVLRTGLVLASPSPRTLVVWRRRATDPAGEPGYRDIALSQMPETAQYAITADVRNDRVFVVTSTGLVATIRRASTREPSVEYHNVDLDGGSFSAAWAGGGRIALWGKDGLGSIDTRTWTTDSVADGVTGALATPYGMAAWTARRDGVSVYRPDGSRRLHVLDGTRVTAARAIGAYVYADTDVNTRYSIDLRTRRTVGSLSARTQLVGPSFVAIP